MRFKFLESGRISFQLCQIIEQKHKDQVRCVCGNENFFATGSYDNRILTYKFNEEEKCFEVDKEILIHEGYLSGLEYLSKTNELVSVSHDGTMKIYSLSKDCITCDYGLIHEKPISALHIVTPDEEEIITGSWDHTCKVFGRDSTEHKIILYHESNILAVLKMPDGFVIAGCADNKVYVWNKNYEIVKTLTDHSLSVRSLDFTYNLNGDIDGFISGANDGYLKFYSPSYELKDSIHAHDNMILSVRSFQDLILTCSEDKKCHFWKRDKNSKYILESFIHLPNIAWDGIFLSSDSSNSEIPEIVTISADGNSYILNPFITTKKKNEEEEEKEIIVSKTRISENVISESTEKMKCLFLQQLQEDHGVVPANHEKMESIETAMEHLTKVTEEQKSENILKHHEFRFFTINELVKIFRWNKILKRWEYLMNFVEIPGDSFCREEISEDYMKKEEDYDDDDNGYESPTEEVDLEFDDLWNNTYRFYNRKKQISLHGITSIYDKDIKDFKICDDCNEKVSKYYHCFECLESVDICEKCYGLKKPETKYHLHDNTDYFCFVEFPRYKSWFDISLSSTCKQVITKCFKYYSGRPCLGIRKTTKENYRWITYDKLYEEMNGICFGLNELNVLKGSFIGIISAPSMHYVCVDLGCIMNQYVSVPIQRVLAAEKKESIIRSTNLECLFCSEEFLEDLCTEVLFNENVEKMEKLKIIIVLPSMNESISLSSELTKKIFDNEDCPFKTLRLEELLKLGKVREVREDEGMGKSEEEEERRDENEDERIITVVHTSGTTTMPKGVVFRERSWMYYLLRECRLVPLVVMGLFPFSHNSGRFDFLMTFCNGGRMALVSDPGMTSLLSDCSVVNPTIISLVPRVMSFFYGCFQDDISIELSKLKNKDDEKEQKIIKSKVFKKYQKMNVFGSRAPDLSVGGAKSSPKVKRFFRMLLKKPVYDTFGSTEVGLISFNFEFDPSKHRIRDCPALGYFGTDKPFGRGELLVKVTKPVEYFVPGNLKQPKNDLEGEKEIWYETGDIVEIRGNKMLVIDRKSNIVKVASGEFISLETVENVLISSCPSIFQMILFPSSVALVGIVVIASDTNVLDQEKEEEETEGEDDDDDNAVCNDGNKELSNDYDTTKLKDLIMKEIQSVGKSHPLNLWEIPSGIIITKEQFSHENGLLTVTKKKIRRKIIAKYKTPLSKLLEHQNKMLTSSSSIQEFIYNILGVKLEDGDEKSESFVELGGDSLTAIRVMNELKRRGMEISYKDLRETPLSDILTRMKKIQDNDNDNEEEEKKGSSEFITFEEEQKEIEKLLKSFEKKEPREKISNVFLTGSSGFLGQFILRDLLTEFSEDVNIICLMRSEKSIKKIQIVDVTSKRIQFVFGDLSTPKFGLGDEEFNEIVSKTDVIVHNGAMVNHFLPYSDHYDANVRSLKDIITISEGSKPIIYVSSVSVYPHGLLKIREDGKNDDDDFNLIKEAKHHRRDGYATSKWVADCLCSKLPNCVLARPSLIFGEIGGKYDSDSENNQKVVGMSNLKDWMNIIMKVMIKHKLVPSTNLDNHLDLIPVDYCSHVISRCAVKSLDLISGSYGGNNKFNLVSKNVQVKEIVDSILDYFSSVKNEEEEEEEEEGKFTKLPFNVWIREVEKKEREGDQNRSEFLPFLQVLRVNEMIGEDYRDIFLKVPGQEKNQEVLMKEIIGVKCVEKVYTKESLLRLVQFIVERMK